MAYKEALHNEAWCKAREGSTAIAADNATLTDANFPPAGALDCQSFETVWAQVAIDGGSSPTMTLEALFRDEDAPDGSRWVRNRDAAGVLTTPALAPGQAFEITVDGWSKVFLRVSAVTNAGSTTGWKILVRPGKRRRPRGSI
jgi:hypothetical protein